MKYLSLLSLALLAAPAALADEPAAEANDSATVVEPVKFRFTDVKVIQ